MSPTRLVGLRVAAMAALPASTILTYDRMHPDRAFCPLAEACERARESLFGSVAGVPTSTLGLAAFAGLFLLTLLPERWGRPVLRPAAVFAGLAGLTLIGYQAFFLPAFCPVCLIADVAGIAAALFAWNWRSPPHSVLRRAGEDESDAARIAWTLGAILVIVIPFAWPRESKPGWVEIAPQTALLEGVTPDRAMPAPDATRATPSTDPSTPLAPDGRGVYAVTAPSPSLLPSATRPAAVPAPTPPIVVSKPIIGIVEYLNAYCSHCRATHRRLDKVLSELDVAPRRRRIYTWSSGEAPLWARACAYASTRGLEDRLFEELLSTTNGDARDVFGAAQRVGLDPTALRQALDAPSTASRINADRRLAQGADLKGLPTLDIGRRRLLGEQSESELRDAVLAAIASPAR